MPTAMKRTNIYLDDDDRALADYIQQQVGLRSLSSVIRLAIRRLARQVKAEERRQPGPGGASMAMKDD